jgi:hypothetical protein
MLHVNDIVQPPDAIVAPNAGLLSYNSWASVILFCHVEEVPFGVTEYAEQSAETRSRGQFTMQSQV